MKKPIHKFKIAESWADIKLAVNNCLKSGYCCHDFETNAEPPDISTSFITMIGLSWQPGSCIIIPLLHSESPFKKDYFKILDYIAEKLIINPDIVKIAQNAKFENKWWLKYGWDFRGRVFDTMLAHHLLDENTRHGLDVLVNEFFPQYEGYKDDTAALARKYGWANIPLQELATRCALDCDLTLRLMIHFEKKLMDNGFYKIFRSEKMPLSNCLAHSEFGGIPIDVPYLDGLMVEYEKKIADVEKAVKGIKKVRIYERKRKEKGILDLIQKTKEEIAELLEEGKSENDRTIISRQQKISKYIAGELITKKEQKAIEPLNFNSPAQMIDFLFTSKAGLGLKVVKFTKNKDKKNRSTTQTPSTDEEVLLELQKIDKTGFISNLLKLRELGKLYSTYIKGMREKVNPETKRIHGNFLVHGTVTQRLSSREPNLQNIPRDSTASDIKRMFLAPPGLCLLEVDYGQAELRIVAQLAQDKTMIDIFKKGYNIHVATACKMNNRLNEYEKIKAIIAKAETMSGKDLEKPENKEYLFWTKEKKKGKSLNFSILYGQGAPETAKTLCCSVEEAKQFKRDWFKAYPQVELWIKNQDKFVSKHGYVKTIFGAKRRLPDIWSDQDGFVAKALRDSINAPIQGSSGQFTNMACNLIKHYMTQGKLPGVIQQAYTVHDSIGYFVEPKLITQSEKIITQIMENPETMKYFGFEMTEVRMKVSSEVSVRSWGELTSYDAWKNYDKLINKATI